MLGASKQIQVLANPIAGGPGLTHFLSNLETESGFFSVLQDMTTDSTGNVYVGGYSNEGATVAKLAPDGTLLAANSYSGVGNLFDIESDSEGNLVAFGESSNSLTVLRLNSDLSVVWARTYNPGASGVTARSVRFLSDGKIVIYGDWFGTQGPFYVTVLNSDGSTSVSKIFETTGTARNHIAMNLTVDSNDNIYVTGQQNSTNPDEMYIAKLTSGLALSWIKWIKYAYTASRGEDIVVDAAGDVYVPCKLLQAEGISLVKLQNSSGNPFWAYNYKMTSETGYSIYGVGYSPTVNRVFVLGSILNSTDGTRAVMFSVSTSGTSINAKTFDSGTANEASYEMRTDINGDIVAVMGTIANASVWRIPSNLTKSGEYTVGNYTWDYQQATNYLGQSFAGQSLGNLTVISAGYGVYNLTMNFGTVTATASSYTRLTNDRIDL